MPPQQDEQHRHEHDAVVVDGEHAGVHDGAASERVAQIADLHAVAQERHAGHGDPVARLRGPR